MNNYGNIEGSGAEFEERQRRWWWDNWKMRVDFAGPVPSIKFGRTMIARADTQIERDGAGPADPDIDQLLRHLRFDVAGQEDDIRGLLTERESVDRRLIAGAEWFRKDEQDYA